MITLWGRNNSTNVKKSTLGTGRASAAPRADRGGPAPRRERHAGVPRHEPQWPGAATQRRRDAKRAVGVQHHSALLGSAVRS